MKILLLALLILLSPNLWASKVNNSGTVFNDYKSVIKTQKYDSLFKKHEGKVHPHLNRHMLKAMAIVESRLNPKAVSKEHARGLMQITPSTWRLIVKQDKSIPIRGYFDPNYSILAAVTLLHIELNTLEHLPNGPNKVDVLLAAYNAGGGNVSKAMDKCNSRAFMAFKRCLPSVTGKSNAKQTVNYVQAVNAVYNELRKE
jgi:soluble lytic murein transglycosylase-like protein